MDKLTKQEFKQIAKELRLLELCGNTLKLPHSRSLGKALFELRERKYGFRIYYTFDKNNRIVLLHGGNKHSQPKDINFARQQRKRYKGGS